jgi:hypothetical protein
MNTQTTHPYDRNNTGQSSPQPQAHFFIYKDLAYVSDRRFDKDHISIGRSPQADVILNHQSVADIHALVHFEGEQAFLTNRYPNNGLRLNGRSVGIEALQHEDIIDIGPFSLKIRIAAPEAVQPCVPNVRYAVRLVNRYDSPTALQQAAQGLSKLLRSDISKVSPLIAKDHFIIKKNLDGMEATRWQNTLLKAGIVCDLQIEEALPPGAPGLKVEERRLQVEPVRLRPAEDVQVQLTRDAVVAKKKAGQADEFKSKGSAAFQKLIEDEEDDEDEVWEAPFSLSQKLGTSAPRIQGSEKFPTWMQVVKTIGNSVVDAAFLVQGTKYSLDTGSGRTCLVHFRSKNESLVYITPQMSGFLENSRGETTADLNSFKTDDYLFSRRKSLYRIPFPENGAVVVSEGGCRYRIATAAHHPSAEVTVARPEQILSWRHWACSTAVHVLFLLCISVSIYFQASAPKLQGPLFVKIDPSLLKQLEPVKAPEPPKVQPPLPEPEPQKAVQKVEPAKTKPPENKAKPDTIATKAQKTSPKATAAVQPSRHPNAGGGFGEGNIKNRNINQAGILSVLGGVSLGGPSEAIAAVTNLDAVPVPGASEKNFTVGGLKGSLGNGKISMATGEIVQTKSSQQVLRSAGARGNGDVAALERGTTGKKQVQAMVTAKMSSTVKIEGGMSRELVKRVIDQHLDEITYCYEMALMSNPSILGRIVFEWKILMDGRVGEIRIVASSVNSTEIHDCIKSSIKSWQFPKPVGAEVVVSYPFVFDLVAF